MDLRRLLSVVRHDMRAAGIARGFSAYLRARGGLRRVSGLLGTLSPASRHQLVEPYFQFEPEEEVWRAEVCLEVPLVARDKEYLSNLEQRLSNKKIIGLDASLVSGFVVRLGAHNPRPFGLVVDARITAAALAQVLRTLTGMECWVEEGALESIMRMGPGTVFSETSFREAAESAFQVTGRVPMIRWEFLSQRVADILAIIGGSRSEILKADRV